MKKACTKPWKRHRSEAPCAPKRAMVLQNLVLKKVKKTCVWATKNRKILVLYWFLYWLFSNFILIFFIDFDGSKVSKKYLKYWLQNQFSIIDFGRWFFNILILINRRCSGWSISARLPSKMNLWSSKTKVFCETSFKIEPLKLKNETFLRDFLQNWTFEAQKRNFSARLPSKMKLWSSKTKLLCETCFKNEALKLKNEAFVRDLLQKRSFEDQKRSIFARLPSKMKLWRSKTKHFCETSFKNDMSTRHLTSEFQYVLGIRSPVTATRNDHCKVTFPSHEICNLSTVSASQTSNIDFPKHEILVPATRNASFQTLFKSPTPANVFVTLTNSCACHVFCNVSKSLPLPRETHFEPQKTSRDRQFLTILTSESLSRAGVVQILSMWTSKSAPTPPVFNDFDFQIALARRRGANFVDVNFQKCSRHASF